MGGTNNECHNKAYDDDDGKFRATFKSDHENVDFRATFDDLMSSNLPT